LNFILRNRSKLITYILPALAGIVVASGYSKVKSENRVCNQQFALCTSALCVPQPGDATKAICFCDVKQGHSMSTVPCDQLRPSTDENGIRTVYSTFSLDQFKQGLQAMKCPDGTPWTWCLNKRCTVDPTHPDKAICVCDVVRTGEWTTLGGNCDTKTCSTGYWSAATIPDAEDGAAFMQKSLGKSQPAVKWCSAAQ
jgi:hypothetical protein